MLTVVLTVTCPAEGWLPWDMNYDGLISIIGDVPPFVDCVYFADCYCPGPGCVCPGDCDASGFLSIIGDVQCFVDCVYFTDCEERGGAPPPAGPPETFTIGGAIYADLDEPLGSGLEGVRIQVIPLKPTSPAENGAATVFVPDPGVFAGPGDQPAWITTSGRWGLWQIDGVPEGRYAVRVAAPGMTFQHVANGVPVDTDVLRILVNAENQAANQSIQFLASE
jgi:hypothetical protein